MPSEVPMLSLDAHYAKLEDRWRLSERTVDYSVLVTPNGNNGEPFHRWFHFKEGYSHALLKRLFKDASWSAKSSFSIIDPFVGGGTTLLSAIQYAEEQGVSAALHGVERNPALHAIAESKVLGRIRGDSLIADLDGELEEFWKRYHSLRRSWSLLTTPSSTLNNVAYFPQDHVRALLALSRAADEVRDVLVRTLLRAAIAASVEGSGRIRRDGRALRFAPTKEIHHPKSSVISLLGRMREDLYAHEESLRSTATIEFGDARCFKSRVDRDGFDWAVFSPPYPNNIDYTEVYKVEAWALEMFGDSDAMRGQRLSTLRSHPSVRFPDNYVFKQASVRKEIQALIGPLMKAVPSDRYARGRYQLVQGYADDMFQVLGHLRPQMSSGGNCAIIVGNSAHGLGDDQFVVASDLIIARLAELTGWKVDEIRVARYLTRRGAGQQYARESVIALSAS